MRRSTTVLQADDLIPPCAYTDVRDPRLDELLQPIDVRTRLRWQILETPRVAGGPLPTFHPLVTRHDLVDDRDVARKLGVEIAVVFVARADRDAIQGVEHVELRNCDVGESVDTRRIPNHHRVEPAAPARTSRRRTEFVAERAHSFCH